MSAKPGIENQPLNRIEWVEPATLRANNYNPNHVAPPEMELLKLSILEDGWTQPIVARLDNEIVDGFHRWTLGSTDPEVRALTGGLVPVTRLNATDMAHQMMSTIRHNRARGTHRVVRMADIVRSLAKEFHMPEDEIMRRLGMEDEEVERLTDHGGMTQNGRAKDFGTGWVPE